jgi:hypothetical protein
LREEEEKGSVRVGASDVGRDGMEGRGDEVSTKAEGLTGCVLKTVTANEERKEGRKGKVELERAEVVPSRATRITTVTMTESNA